MFSVMSLPAPLYNYPNPSISPTTHTISHTTPSFVSPCFTHLVRRYARRIFDCWIAATSNRINSRRALSCLVAVQRRRYLLYSWHAWQKYDFTFQLTGLRKIVNTRVCLAMHHRRMSGVFATWTSMVQRQRAKKRGPVPLLSDLNHSPPSSPRRERTQSVSGSPTMRPSSGLLSGGTRSARAHMHWTGLRTNIHHGGGGATTMSAATTVCKCGHIFHRGDSAFCRKCGAKRDVSALHSMHPLHLAQAASPMTRSRSFNTMHTGSGRSSFSSPAPSRYDHQGGLGEDHTGAHHAVGSWVDTVHSRMNDTIAHYRGQQSP